MVAREALGQVVQIFGRKSESVDIEISPWMVAREALGQVVQIFGGKSESGGLPLLGSVSIASVW
jgi:hypothetical protein